MERAFRSEQMQEDRVMDAEETVAQFINLELESCASPADFDLDRCMRGAAMFKRLAKKLSGKEMAGVCRFAARQDIRMTAFMPEEMQSAAGIPAVSIHTSPNGRRHLLFAERTPEEERRSRLLSDSEKKLFAKPSSGSPETAFLDFIDQASERIFPGALMTADLMRLGQRGQVLCRIAARTADDERFRRICLDAVERNGLALMFIPKGLQTPEICMAAVRKDGEALGFVLEAMRTPELCAEAVRQNPEALKHVPEELMTETLFMQGAAVDPAAALRGLIGCRFMDGRPKWDPDGEKRRAVYAKAEQEGRMKPKDEPPALERNSLKGKGASLPQKETLAGFFRREIEAGFADIGTASFRGRAQEGQERFKQAAAGMDAGAVRKVCFDAVRRDGRTALFIPEDALTMDMCMAALRQSAEAARYLMHAGPAWRAASQILNAEKEENMKPLTEEEKRLIKEFSPERPERTLEEFARYASGEEAQMRWSKDRQRLVHDGRTAFRASAKTLPDEELLQACTAAVGKCGMALEFLPQTMWTPEICRAAALQDCRALKLMPYNLTPELAAEVVRKNPEALEYVPKRLLTEDFFMRRASGNGVSRHADAARPHAPRAQACMKASRSRPMAETSAGMDGNAARKNSAAPAAQTQESEKWLAAVSKDASAINSVPSALQEQTCMQALMRRPTAENFAALFRALDGAMPSAACMFMAERDGRILKLLPDAAKTPELCAAAIRSHPAAVQWTPEPWRMEEPCRSAVAETPEAAAFIGDRSAAVSLAAQNPACLKSLPNYMLTKAFLKAVDVERNGDSDEKKAHRRRLAMAGPDGLALIPPEHLGAGLRAMSRIGGAFGRRLATEETAVPTSRRQALEAAPARLKMEIAGLLADAAAASAAKKTEDGRHDALAFQR